MKGLLSIFPILLCSLPLSADISTVALAALPVSGSTLAPGQPDIPLLAFTAVSDNGGSIDALSVTYTGEAGADIASGSVRLFLDYDGDWATDGDRGQLGSALSFSGNRVSFAGFSVACDSMTPLHFFLIASIAPSAIAGNEVGAVIQAPDDITVREAGLSGLFPLNSLSAPHRIAITPTRLSIDSLPATVTAGQTVTFTVSAVDSHGNVATTWNGSQLSIEGTPGAAPGTSPNGDAPSYAGGGPWSASDKGRKQCSFTLYKAEEDRQIRISDTSLGTYDRGGVAVDPGGGARMQVTSIPDQTAGVPFTVTVSMTDQYGNPGHAGSVTALSAGTNITSSPSGSAPAFPAPYTWKGTEPQGQKTFSVVLYDQCQDARLKVSGAAAGTVFSNAFSVGEGALARYTVSGPLSVALKTRTTYTIAAEDGWGNALAKYSGTALLSASDARAAVPLNAALAAGTGVFSVIFMTWGNHVITAKDQANSSVKGSLAISVDRPPSATGFSFVASASVNGGKPFGARITARNDADEAVTDYNKTVRLSIDAPASIRPETVVLAGGIWEGNLIITGETLRARISVSDGQTTTASAGQVLVNVADYRKARTYPTVFTPRKETVKIRYFLQEDRDVTVKVYDTAMDMVRELRFPAASPGGQQGLNVIEWNGKGGDADAVGHSGAYPILIDKGYEKEWTGAVIKNFN